jgi:hypothetical protein
MSFREKITWVRLSSIVLVSGFYFLHLPWSLQMRASGEMFHGLVGCIVALILIEVVAHIALAMRSPKEAEAPKDERERLIDLKATSLAAYVYAFGSLGAISIIHLGANQFAVSYGVLVAFVVAEVFNYAARIIYYRRGV